MDKALWKRFKAISPLNRQAGLPTLLFVRTADFDFELPQELIAQHPAVPRDASRLLVLQRATGAIQHRRFAELPTFLQPGDVLVLNNSRVIPARIFGRNSRTGGRFELLLLQEVERNEWWVMLKPGKRARLGTEIQLTHHGSSTSLSAKVIDVGAEGHRRLRFEGTTDIRHELDSLGIVPLPPYIVRPPGPEDRQRYQTVYATYPGSIAAPTAGLHFTEQLLDRLRNRGVSIHWVTLHIGLGTFAPVKADLIRDHAMHEEQFELSSETATAINTAKREGRRVIAVGTTTVRVLESVAASAEAALGAVRTGTRIFIYPPFQFRVVDALLTNFHLPRSTLLMLVSAFAAPGDLRGRDLIRSAYHEAIRKRYRFFSYGDAMLML